MITIQKYEQAKKITSALFTAFKKEKLTLNSFRMRFAKELGYNSLEDAFRKENEEKLLHTQKSYITYLDDPRITIDVAREIGVDDDFEFAKAYFEKNLANPSDDILFPVKDEYELRSRCEQILILWNENEWFTHKNYVNLILKMAMPQSRISYVYDGKENRNPELLMAKEILGFNNKFMSIEDLAEQHINYKDLYSPEDGFYDAIEKTKLFVAGIIWTQTNVGSSYHENVLKESNKIGNRNTEHYLKNLKKKA